jgi:hypothetical protein
MLPNRSTLNLHLEWPRRKKALLHPLSMVAVCLFALASGSLGRAQAVGSGQIQGTILDVNGSAVPNATVEAVQAESGLHRVVNSGADGGYNLPSLPVGNYQLKVTATGFSTFSQSGILIQVGNNLRLDVKLQVGGVTQTV